jgi:hypothetical protein
MSTNGTHEERAGTISLADEESVKQILVSTVFGFSLDLQNKGVNGSFQRP